MKILKKDYLNQMNKKKTILFFLFLLSIFSTFSLFLQKYIINGQDFMFHFSRLEGVIMNIKENNLFSGIYPHQLNHYGYAAPLFYPDIFLYFPALLVVLGLKKYTAYKIFLFIINFFSIFFMYLATKNMTKDKKIGLFASILYAASSYRLTDMFERCALGENITFVFLPLVFWGIYEIIEQDENKYYLLTIGMTGLILSHLITSVLTCIILFLICLCRSKKLLEEKSRIKKIIYAALLTLLLTSFFLLPMLEQMMSQKYAVNAMMNSFSLANYATKLSRLFFVIPGIVYCKLFQTAWLPAGFGLSFLIIIILIGKYSLKNTSKDKITPAISFSKILFLLGLATIFFATNLFPWKLKIVQKLFSFMQFPWRVFSLSTTLILTSFALYQKEVKKTSPVLTNILILLSIPVIFIFNFYNLSAKYLQDTLGSDFDTISYGEYLPLSQVVTKWDENQSKYYEKRENKVVSLGEVNLKTKRKGKYLIIEYQNNQNNEVILPLLYYKGYDIKENNQNLNYQKSKEGLIKVNLKDKEGKIIAYYKGTPLFIYTKIISFLGLISFIFIVKKNTKKKTKNYSS